MLSVPPAFVLSQDQTLYKSCISISLRCIEIYPVHNACVITAFFSLVLTFLFPNLLGKRNLKGRYFFLALFGFQDAVFAFRCFCYPVLRLLYYSIAFQFCQAKHLLFIYRNYCLFLPQSNDTLNNLLLDYYFT